jgi:hypothetical protein
MTDCFRGGWPYEAFEVSFLTFCREVDLSSIALKDDNESTRISDAIRAKEGELVETNSQLEKTYELVTGKSPSKFLQKKFQELEAGVVRLEGELEELKAKQNLMSGSSAAFEEGKLGLSELVRKFQTGEDVFSLRTSLSFHLRNVIEEVRVFAGGMASKLPPEAEQMMRDAYAERWDGYKSALPPLSPERRFFIVIFKSGSYRLVRPDPDDAAVLALMLASDEPWRDV